MRLAAFFLIVLPLAAQTYQPGPQFANFHSDVDDSEQPYALYLPKGFDPAKTYPLAISLHGEDSNHRINLLQVFGKGNLALERAPVANRYFPPLPDVNYIVAAPLARGTMGYQGIAEKDVYDLLGEIEKRFPIDPDRVYLTGAAMGGGGALWLGLTRPDVWAAIAPVCPEAPAGTEALAANALYLPVRLFQGELDPAVPVETSRAWNRELLRVASPVEYMEYPMARHNAWDFAYKDGAIFRWFDKFRRNRFPTRVRYVTEHYRYSHAYWVRLDELEPGVPASIDAVFSSPNQLTVTTRNLLGFTLLLAGHPSFSSARPLIAIVDGQKLRGGKSASPSFTKTAKGWQPGLATIAPGLKRPGAEGPISEAVAGRHIYVYGTAGHPTVDDLLARRAVAQHAADWSTARHPLRATFRVLSDREIQESDAANASLILFGDKDTNERIARLADRLPIALNPSAADYGLLFVFPFGGRYVLINSGLPWWTGDEEATRPGLPFVPFRYRLLLSFGDYILFKGSLENVVAQGTFTNDWKVPAGDLKKMRETGALAEPRL
ncbi:MAG TPA: alpha/beta hydrolase-fold protein [Bryobacteraceae bacterium]|nr:alpha/beta hydrolase-fold protein [Bryobacteraceae bacterium]